MFNKEYQVERSVHEEFWNYFWENSFEIIREPFHSRIDTQVWNRTEDKIHVIVNPIFNKMRSIL